MKYIDTHSHLYSNKFDPDIDAVIDRAKKVLEAVYLPNIDLDSVEAMHSLTDKDPEFFFPMIGLHPSSVKDDFEQVLTQLRTYLDASLIGDNPYKYCGIGETGLDLYWDKTTLELQKASLQIQIDWAKELGLPIILHARDAIDEVTEMISSNHSASLFGIFHCFDGSLEQAHRIMELGNFKIGIGGIVTYRKDVQEMVQQVPLEYIVLETDSPYLPPEPHRKDKPRRNESSYTQYVGAKLAELFSISEEEVSAVTNANAKEVFQVLTSS